MRLTILILCAALLAGCTATRAASTSYGVSADGTVSAETRSALSGSTAPGRQEIIGIYLPFPGTGLAAKAGLEWDGLPVVIGPTPQVAPQAAAPCGVQTTYVEETYTEMVPVQRTRQVPVRSVTLPVPKQAAPCQPVPPPEPVAAICPAPAWCVACAGGK